MRGLVALSILGLLLLAPNTIGHGETAAGLCKAIDIMFVIDKDGGLSNDGGQATLQQTASYVTGLTNAMWTGVRSFPATSLDKTLNGNNGDTSAAILAPPAVGPATFLDAAKLAMQDLLDKGRTDAYPMLVLISDGHDDSAVSYVQTTVQNQYNVPVYVIQVEAPNAAAEATMYAMASPPKMHFFREVIDSNSAPPAVAQLKHLIDDCGAEFHIAFVDGCAPWKEAELYVARLLGFLVRPAAAEIHYGDGSKDQLTTLEDTVYHKFPEPGTYDITYILWDTPGTEYKQTISVEIPSCQTPPIEASFSCAAVADKRGFVQFTDESFSPYFDLVSWSWELGDGAESTEREPVHEYKSDGPFNVTLTVRDEAEQVATATRKCSTKVNNPPSIHMDDLLVYEGDLIAAPVKTSDPDGDELTVTSDQGAQGNQLPSDAVFDGNALNWQTAAGDAGTYGPIAVVVDDGQASDEATFYVRVLPSSARSSNDADRDGVRDESDNCPNVKNRDQRDSDKDGIGDACTIYTKKSAKRTETGKLAGADTDGDGAPDSLDNCPLVENSDQADLDLDNWGDACDTDRDDDGIPDIATVEGVLADNCPDLPNPVQLDTDRDGIGDRCDPTPFGNKETGSKVSWGGGEKEEPKLAIDPVILAFAGMLVLAGLLGAIIYIVAKPSK